MIEKNLKVLLLEDLRTDQILIQRAIQKAAPNAIFTIANNREEFLEKLNWARPDIILSDYNLPNYNGLDALLYIKENLPYVPFVFVTGCLNDEEQIAQTILRGASDYILKDNLSKLTDKLEEIIAQASARLAAESEIQKKRDAKQMLLQKLQGVLNQAAPFPEKQALKEILAQILEKNDAK